METRRTIRYPDSQQLFVGNVPHDVDKAELKEFFERECPGKVLISVTIVGITASIMTSECALFLVYLKTQLSENNSLASLLKPEKELLW